MVRRFPRVLALTLSAASLAMGVVVIDGPAASAQSVKAQIASAHVQLNHLRAQEEIASERYDAAQIKLQAAQRQAATAQDQLKAAQHHLSALQDSASQFAVAAYRGSASTSLLSLARGSASDLVGKVSTLQAVSDSESQTLAAVDGARRVEEQAQVNANAALASARSAAATIAASRNQIIAASQQEQTVLANLQAKEAAIIKAAKARAARLAAERIAAALKARQEAAARAQKRLEAQPPTPPTPAPTPTPTPPTSPPTHHHHHQVSASGGAATAVQWAYNEIGKPYVWAAAGPNSFDCSGLTMYVWGKAGVSLEHYTGDQWNEGTHVSRDQLQPGDLVFFATNTSEPSTIHHVGIYVGGGDMIDAPYTGVDVRKEPAFRSDYIGAVRPG